LANAGAEPGDRSSKDRIWVDVCLTSAGTPFAITEGCMPGDMTRAKTRKKMVTIILCPFFMAISFVWVICLSTVHGVNIHDDLSRINGSSS
jgi:hypothetical protein